MDNWKFSKGDDAGSGLHAAPRSLSLTLRPDTSDTLRERDWDHAIEAVIRQDYLNAEAETLPRRDVPERVANSIRLIATFNSIPQTPVPALPPIARSLSLQSTISDAEQECFDFFLQRSVLKLPGLNIPKFWRSTLLQASTTERPVLHAVLALGSLHQQGAGQDLRGHEGPKLETFMLRQYALALRELGYRQRHDVTDLTARKKPSPKELSVTVITAVVFVYFEFLREHYTDGCKHLQFILQLLNECGNDFGIPPCGPNYMQMSSKLLRDDWILEPILRLYIQANMLGQTAVPLPKAFQAAAVAPLPSLFTSLQHARWYLDLLTATILHLQYELRGRHLSTLGYVAEATSSNVDILHTATIVQSQLHVWKTTFAATMTAISDRATQRDHFRYISYGGAHRLAVIMIDVLLRSIPSDHPPTSSSTSPNFHFLIKDHSIPSSIEDLYDTHHHLFHQNLLTAITQYTVSSSPTSRRAIIGIVATDRKHAEPTIDQGWLYHLFFTAIKCRVHRIRQHALRLMRTTWHKEGIWDTGICVRVVEECLRLEEGDIFHQGGVCDCAFELMQPPPEPRGNDRELDLVTTPTYRRLEDLRVCLPSSPDAGSELDSMGTPLAIEYVKRDVLGRRVWERREFVRVKGMSRGDEKENTGRWQGRWVRIARRELDRA
ncbi:uncharacterized protein AB675_4654 [Cyphellophora attinorum]|uniref:Uncharacterized protein n=1 Tax=Cyphellophora attinorum TaxID=1664694 RepID=A0A0N0NLC2_9EURO|nr:uncharacterized protein AB675_4654 [Phialophora attinorum]KPI39121.1 hypothetical protein AB675_4654 [Phialophora attinorum]